MGYIQFADNTSLSLQSSFAINQEEKDIRSVKLFGSKEGANLFPLKIYREEEGQLVNLEFPFFEMRDWHMDLDTNFVHACLGKEDLLVTARQGAYVQKIICGLYESAETGKPVIF